MKGNLEERAIALGEYVKDLTKRLKQQNHALYNSVQKVLQLNKNEHHLRGAAARQKYHPCA